MTDPARPTTTLDAARAEMWRAHKAYVLHFAWCSRAAFGHFCPECRGLLKDADAAGNRLSLADDHAGRAT